MAYSDDGYRYLKNGDSSGDLCKNVVGSCIYRRVLQRW